MTNGGGMNMVVSKNYKIKEQNGMYYCELCKKVTLKSIQGSKNVIISSRLFPLLR